MTAHACREFDPTCYRCELGKDEVKECPDCGWPEGSFPCKIRHVAVVVPPGFH